MANGLEKCPLQHLESCTGVWVGKTPCYWAGEMSFATFRIMHWSLVVQDSTLDRGQEKSRLQHLESCTGV